MPQDDTSIFRSSTAAAHSVSSSINPDGKEYESYGEWDAYLSQFIKTYFPQIIQDDLYVTPQQVFAVTLVDDSGDIDKEKKSFRVPDASLRFRKAEQLQFEAFKAQYLNDNPDSQVKLLEAVQSLISWDLADGWIPSVQMDSLLVFIEIKPGASWKRLKFNYRMFDECMETWMWEFYQHLDQACDQAREQAQYFFKKNPDRDLVVAFATASFKWCWRVFERSEIGEREPFVDNTFGAPSSDPSFGSSPASAKNQEKSGKRRPRVSTDSQPSHPDNTRPAPKRTKISDGSSSPSNSPDHDPQADVSQSTGLDPSETTDDSAAGSPEPPRNAPFIASDSPDELNVIPQPEGPTIFEDPSETTDDSAAGSPEPPRNAPFIASDSPDELNVIPQPEGPTIFEEIWQTYMDNIGCFRDVICGEIIQDWSPVNNWGTPNSQGEEEKAAIAMVRSQPKRITDLPVFRTFLLDHGIDLDAEEDSELDEED